MNSIENELKNTIPTTEKKLNEETSKDIIKKWERNCPSCNSIIYHTSKCNRDRLQRLNCKCSKCLRISQRLYKTEVLKRECIKCKKEIFYKNRKTYNQAERQNRLCINCADRPLCREETKLKIGYKNKGYKNGMFGKTLSVEVRKSLSDRIKKHNIPRTKEGIEKMKISLRKRAAEKFLEFGFKGPRTNFRSCKWIDDYGKQNGYNFRHGLNGGEFYVKDLGYFVDGYDKEKNIIFEYDEPYHYINGKLREKDIKRMNEIKNHLRCKFIRYNEKLKEVIEY
jgi:hypothetical protein